MLKRIACMGLGIVLSAFVCEGAFTCKAFAQAEHRTRARQVETVREAAQPAAEATVVLPEQFLNSLLDVMFTKLKAPSFPLSLAGNRSQSNVPSSSALARSTATAEQCASEIVLEREMGGVKTAVRFVNGKIVAPIAFTGSYNVALLGCIRFQGWADTNINLEFDRARQTLNARVQVSDIHLNNVPTLANGIVVDLVQNSIDQRINPVEILQATQLSTRLPIAASGGALRLQATEVRPEIIPGLLRLHIFYEFVRD